MTTQERLLIFKELGKALSNLSIETKEEWMLQTKSHNSWFTEDSINLALNGLIHMLDAKKLDQWLSAYNIPAFTPRNVGIIMAGNIPLVGFHDMLCTLLTGHNVYAKTSHLDDFLPQALAQLISEISPEMGEKIHFQEQLKNLDAYIATGSDNSARYFNQYFGKYPHIIRKNRTSVGIVNGKESKEDFDALGFDIFSYFGLGCRNVSKILIPEGFDLTKFLDAIEGHHDVIHHHKYSNNYDYNKSIYLINGVTHLDNGFLMLKESLDLVSPISVLFHSTYQSVADLEEQLSGQSEKLQCVVSKDAWVTKSLPFGKAQFPELWDYADGVDTVDFLINLK